MTKHVTTIRWEKFARGMISHGDSARAYQEAGFRTAKRQQIQANAARLMARQDFKEMFDRIKAEIEARNQEARALAVAKTALDREWVLDNLAKVYERCMQAVPVLDREGKETGEYRFEPTGAIKALELIGMENQMFLRKPGSDAADKPTGPLVNINLIDSRDDFRSLAIEYAPKSHARADA